MIIMPSSNRGTVVGWLTGRFPGRIASLYGPFDWKAPIFFMPYALDNGRYAATTKGNNWDEDKFLETLDHVRNNVVQQPMWLVVPDFVGSRDKTLREWDKWEPTLRQYGWTLAMACQDGMTPDDVPDGVVAFIGGTTKWKRDNIEVFCEELPRVHVGRISTPKWLWVAHNAGAESCDGTGWFRGGYDRYKGLIDYLEKTK